MRIKITITKDQYKRLKRLQKKCHRKFVTKSWLLQNAFEYMWNEKFKNDEE